MKKNIKYILIFFISCIIFALIFIVVKKYFTYQANYNSNYNLKNGSSLWNAKEIGADYFGKPSEGKFFANQYEFCDKSRDPINWPPNDGCFDEPISVTVKKGTVIDRFGGPTGFFVSPYGYSYDQRALPYISNEPDCINYYKYIYNLDNPLQNYHLYLVNKDFDVLSCKASPAFGAPGGAIQYKYSNSIKQLLEDNFISEIEIKNFPPFNS